MNNQYSLPYLEWESITFPVIFEATFFEKTKAIFTEKPVVTVWRNKHHQLLAQVKMRTHDPLFFKQVDYVGKGNIVRGEIIEGYNFQGDKVKLLGCNWDAIQTSSIDFDENGNFMNVEIVFESMYLETTKSSFPQAGNLNSRFEWFLCSEINVHFNSRTIRSLHIPQTKLRIGIDDEYNEIPQTGISYSNDFIQIDINGIKCIIAKVRADLPDNMTGICIEFRQRDCQDFSEELLNDLKHFLSFLFGCKLYHYGNTIVKNGHLNNVTLYDPKLSIYLEPSIPPIHYNFQYDWGRFPMVVEALVQPYLSLAKQLSLNAAIERFWIAKKLPLGINLPILANALEILTAEYLKMTGNNNLTYMSKEEFEEKTENAIKLIAANLDSVEGIDKMINKIKGAYQKGPNEKINLFFKLLDLEIGKAEKAAINLRNKMAHGTRDYSDDENAFDDLILTRAYEVLFNRILLKLLGYDGYYKDYSVKGAPSKPLFMKAGS